MRSHSTPVWQLALPFVVILIAILAGGWGLYDYGRFRAGYDKVAEVEKRTTLQERIHRLEDQVQEFREQSARLQSTKDVDLYAAKAVKDQLEQLQQENLDLREELQFYRNIVSPNKGRPGVRVHHFTLEPDVRSDQFHYNLTLIHIQDPKKPQREIYGVVHLTVEGLLNGAYTKYNLADLENGRKADIKFKFKYFSQFEGNLTLPKNYQPKSIYIEVDPKSSATNGDEKKMDWPGVNGQGDENAGKEPKT